MNEPVEVAIEITYCKECNVSYEAIDACTTCKSQTETIGFIAYFASESER